MARQLPRKRAGIATGPRRFDGALRDVDGIAEFLGETPKAVRAQLARGVLPHRRLGGRIVFLLDEMTEFLRALPGVTAAKAIENIDRRQGDKA